MLRLRPDQHRAAPHRRWIPGRLAQQGVPLTETVVLRREQSSFRPASGSRPYSEKKKSTPATSISSRMIEGHTTRYCVSLPAPVSQGTRDCNTSLTWTLRPGRHRDLASIRIAVAGDGTCSTPSAGRDHLGQWAASRAATFRHASIDLQRPFSQLGETYQIAKPHKPPTTACANTVESDPARWRLATRWVNTPPT
jgi:hypothetical protein